MTHPLVSIVIATKNEENNIENCLISITEQTYPNIEVIVVDNNSTDKTFEIALKFTDKVFDKGPERSTQRNYGMAKIACGKYVMFLDADMILGPKAAEACVYMSENENWIALHIPEFVLGTKYFTRVRRFERSFYNGTVIDGARFLKKSTFVEVGGFDETMSGPEDWDIDKKIKQIGDIGLLPSSSDYLEDDSWKYKNYIIQRGVDPNGKCKMFPKSNTVIFPKLKNLVNFRMVVLDDCLYIIGGKDWETGAHIDKTWRYDPANSHWSQRANMNHARCRHTATVLNGCIYITGLFLYN